MQGKGCILKGTESYEKTNSAKEIIIIGNIHKEKYEVKTLAREEVPIPIFFNI